jgi:demethoxyubiquinone hydroxylase (CLK1/Coq7/Cat5 family)
MKTAVEFLLDKLTPFNWTKEQMQEHYKDAIDQAKEMEKEQNEKYNELKEMIEDMIKHLDEGIHLTLRKDSIIVEALRNSINKK